MADNYLSGKSGSVKIGDTAYSFGKWRLAMKTNPVKATNFTSEGFQLVLDSIHGATLTLEGPYNAGNMAFVVGSYHEFKLGFDATLSLTVTAMVSGIEPAVDCEGGQIIVVTAESNGAFDDGLDQ